MASVPGTEKEISFLSHLEELRARILLTLIVFCVAVVVGYFLAPYPLRWITKPVFDAALLSVADTHPPLLGLEVGPDRLVRVREGETTTTLLAAKGLAIYLPGAKQPSGIRYFEGYTPIVYLHPMDPFVIRLKAAAIIGLILSLPMILYQIWGFIAPGLLPSERKLALPAILSGTLLFPVGAAFAYYMLEATLQLSAYYAIDNTVMMNDAKAYLGFALSMMLAFGAVFELPLVIVIATKVGLVSVDWLAARRKYVFVILLIASAIITPTGDPFNLMAMTLPLYALFEISLLVSRALETSARRDDGEPLDPEASAG
ncbi:hypothetical protein BH09SUM1_BH09SUM1_28190 [soil metagenome]